MKILLIEPFYGGSHKHWADNFKKYSQHEVEILALPDKFWKWRMHGAAVTLAEEFLNRKNYPDLIITTDMLDLCVFQALTKSKTSNIPFVLYFHENQLTYPWSPTDEDISKERNHHYGFINYTSALAANKILFNSQYHLESFTNALTPFLKKFPDHQNLENVAKIKSKSKVLYPGVDIAKLHQLKPEKIEPANRAVILWNHRWEYDKNPARFFEILFELQKRGVEFKLIVLGEKNKKYPPIFDKAKEQLKDFIIHWGYVESFEQYAHLLWQADILLVTSNQDFFGISIVEAMACDVFPLLPNRLAYPEHLPKAYAKTFLYEEKENLANRLQRLIFDVKIIRKQNIHQWVMQYDWETIIKEYDKFVLKP